MKMTEPPRLSFDLTQARGFLLDLDGVVYQGPRLIPGTKKALQILRDRDMPFLFVTNTTSRSRRLLWDRLHGLGVPCSREEIMNAPRVAAALLRERDLDRCLLLAPKETAEDFLESDIEVIPPESTRTDVPAVAVGDLGDRFTFQVLNNAFHRLLDGALLISMSPTKYWKAPDGLRLDAGPFVAALQYASGVEPIVAAKPAPSLFLEGCRHMGLPPGQVAMVGDDAEVDAAGAARAGLLSILVQSGKYRPGDESRVEPPPHGIVKNLLQLVSALPGPPHPR
jgi:HAD superfamily hydrolase (TIGR01458 family)